MVPGPRLAEQGSCRVVSKACSATYRSLTHIMPRANTETESCLFAQQAGNQTTFSCGPDTAQEPNPATPCALPSSTFGYGWLHAPARVALSNSGPRIAAADGSRCGGTSQPAGPSRAGRRISASLAAADACLTCALRALGERRDQKRLPHWQRAVSAQGHPHGAAAAEIQAAGCLPHNYTGGGLHAGIHRAMNTGIELIDIMFSP